MIQLKNSASLTDFQRNARQCIKDLNETKDPMLITVNGKVEAVLVDPETYQKLEREHMIRLIRESEADYDAGRFRNWEEVKAKLESSEKI
jgi:PHD/YefM family antitoxin component YafN of YafNO toxin-antitoxin module